MKKTRTSKEKDVSTLEVQELIYSRRREAMERTRGLSEGDLRRQANTPLKTPE